MGKTDDCGNSHYNEKQGYLLVYCKRKKEQDLNCNRNTMNKNNGEYCKTFDQINLGIMYLPDSVISNDSTQQLSTQVSKKYYENKKTRLRDYVFLYWCL